MQRDRLFMIGGGAVLVIGILFVAWKYHPANNADFPNGTWWICENPACKNEFSMTTTQISDWHVKHYGEPMPCPKCGEHHIIRAFKCQKCSTVFPAEGARVCPKCGAPASDD